MTVKYIRQSNNDILSAKKILRRIKTYTDKFNIHTFSNSAKTALLNSIFQSYEQHKKQGRQQPIEVFYYHKRESHEFNSIIEELIASISDEHGKKIYVDIWICKPILSNKFSSGEIFGNVFVFDEFDFTRYAQNLREYQDTCLVSSGTIHKALLKRGFNNDDFDMQQQEQERRKGPRLTQKNNKKDHDDFQELIEEREFYLFEKFLEHHSGNIPIDTSSYALQDLAGNLGSIDLGNTFFPRSSSNK